MPGFIKERTMYFMVNGRKINYRKGKFHSSSFGSFRISEKEFRRIFGHDKILFDRACCHESDKNMVSIHLWGCGLDSYSIHATRQECRDLKIFKKLNLKYIKENHI